MTTDMNYRLLISAYIISNLDRACTTPEVEMIISAVAMGVMDRTENVGYEIITHGDIAKAAEVVLKYELIRQIGEYDKLLKEKNWLERLFLNNYFKQYKANIEEYKNAVEDICLKR